MSLLVLAPESGTAFAILTNQQRGGEVVKAALDVLRDALGGREPDRVPVVLDPTEYLGTYRTPLIDAELVQTDDGLQLVVTSRGGFPTEDSPPMPSPPPAPIAFYERDRMVVPEARRREPRSSSCAAPTGASPGCASAAA